MIGIKGRATFTAKARLALHESLGHADIRSRPAVDESRAWAVDVLAWEATRTSFIDVLKLFEADPATEAILMMGEIGGTAEEEAAAYVRDHANSAGCPLPAGGVAGQLHGHAKAIISGGKGTASERSLLRGRRHRGRPALPIWAPPCSGRSLASVAKSSRAL